MAGKVADEPLYLQKEVGKTIAVVISGEDLTGNTVKLKVWQYAGASLDINDTGSVAYSAPDTTITFTLTATDTNITWSRGHYAVHDETDDLAKLVGDCIIESVPFS